MNRYDEYAVCMSYDCMEIENSVVRILGALLMTMYTTFDGRGDHMAAESDNHSKRGTYLSSHSHLPAVLPSGTSFEAVLPLKHLIEHKAGALLHLILYPLA
jgi:hypothetical protein